MFYTNAAYKLQTHFVTQDEFADYYPINPDLFTFHIPSYFDVESEVKARVLDRTMEGLVSILQSMRKVPSIRYPKNSDLCFKIGEELAVGILLYFPSFK